MKTNEVSRRKTSEIGIKVDTNCIIDRQKWEFILSLCLKCVFKTLSGTAGDETPLNAIILTNDS